jgi:hypothetical protein
MPFPNDPSAAPPEPMPVRPVHDAREADVRAFEERAERAEMDALSEQARQASTRMRRAR